MTPDELYQEYSDLFPGRTNYCSAIGKTLNEFIILGVDMDVEVGSRWVGYNAAVSNRTFTTSTNAASGILFVP